MNLKTIVYVILINILMYYYCLSQTPEERKLVENYKKIAENLEKSIQKIKPIESVFNTSEFTGYAMSWNENRRPKRIFLSLENSETSEYQIFDYDNGKLVFAFISFGNQNGWQFYFSNNKLAVIIDEKKDFVSKENQVLYKHFEKYLLDRAKKLYSENIGK